MQKLQNGKAHAVGAVVIALGPAADQNVERLRGNGAVQRFCALLRTKVRQKVADDELRVIEVGADLDIDLAAVAAHDLAVQLQRRGDPLILADAAVVMGLQIGHLSMGCLEKWAGLDVQSRCVGVRRADVRALCQRLRTDDGQHDGLAAVIVVDLVAGVQRHAALVLDEAALLGKLDGRKDALTLGLGGIQEPLVILTVGVHFRLFSGAQRIVGILRLVQQHIAFFLCHFAFSFMILSNNASACI